MFKNLNIGMRIQIAFTAVIVVGLGVVLPFVNMQISDLVHEAETAELKNLYKSAAAEIESEGRLATAMSYVISAVPEMSQAMAEGRRDDLAAMTVPLFKNLNNYFIRN